MGFIRKIKKKGVGRIVVCIILTVISLSNIIASIPANALEYMNVDKDKALGSPLMNSEFTSEDWNKWEMLTFGVFLSNFCTPLVDSYKTAFSTGNGGSEGSGREALQFAAGGDVNSKSILNNMLNYCITLQKDISQLKPLYTEYTIYNKNKIDEDATADVVKGNQATLRDILATVVRNKGGIGSDYNDKPFPYVLTNLYSGCTTIGEKGDEYVFEFIEKAALPSLYIEGSNGDITLFDTADGWDVQMLSAFTASIIDSVKDKKDITKMLEKASAYNLYMDSFGNICLMEGKELRVVIPSCVNQHITSDNRYNLLNSLVLNGNYVEENEHKVAAGLEATNEISGMSGEDLIHEIRGGNYGADGQSKNLKPGQVIIFEDTDTMLAQDLYKKSELKEATNYPWEDFTLGKYITNLIKPKTEAGKISNPLKIEVIGGVNEGLFANLDGSLSGDTKIDGENIVNRMAQAASLISNMHPMDTNHETLNWVHSFNKGGVNNGKMLLFDEAIYTANSIPQDKNIKGGKNTNEGVKSYINFYLNYLSNNNILTCSGLDIPDVDGQKSSLKDLKSPFSIAGLMFNNDAVKLAKGAKGSELLMYYLINDSHFGLNNGKTLEGLKQSEIKGYSNYIKNVDMNGKTQFNYNGNLNQAPRRIVKVYKRSSALSIASDILSLSEGTEFSVYSPLIYLTYLDFYGILDGENSNKFNEEIFGNSGFANLTVDIALGDNIPSEEDQKKQILTNTYLMLSPEGGRDYRKSLISNWIEDWMHDEYDNICYGNGGSSAVSSGISTRMSKGFLQIDNYEENFLTSWFLANYSKIVVVLIAAFIVLVIVVGILKGEKFGWFITSLGIVILVFVLAPSTGEVTPYVCNNMIQKMFSQNMTYWAVSESVENASIEKQYSSGSDEDKQVMSLVNSLNILYLDKTLMIKKDISKKIIEEISVDYGDIQKLQSTRWLLPTIIQQISADDGSADYVYTTLTDLYSDMRSAYWLYARNDMAESHTSQFVVPAREYTAYNDSTKSGSIWGGYKATSALVSGLPTTDASSTTKSIARVRESNDENFHTMFYMLDVDSMKNLNSSFKILDPLTTTGYTEYSTEMWNKFGEAVVNEKYNATGINNSAYKSSFQSMANQIMNDASTYNSYSTEPRQCFGYLWTTETPSHYFYQVVKDTFSEDGKAQNLAMLIRQLQGSYELNNDTGEETRRSFMHYGDTGYTRDFLDLEELFTNVIPYLYTVQVLAGGENGENGILGDEVMGDAYPIYKNNLQSWLYRSNWVTKLVEYPNYKDKCTITGRDSNGERVEYEIASPLYPQNYPADDGRPMVFSEAQMHELGLMESDLSIVELKILKINKEVEKNWTMLINYSNSTGILKEVFYRQMTISALLSFNNHMSPDNWVSYSRALYPTTLDLRNISFDAVMKMIILSDTANTAYMSKDTMYSVIEDEDTFSGLLLLATAWIASYLVPFLRDLVLGLMFYLGIISMVIWIFRDHKKAAKSAGGFALSNIVFMVVTILYYLLYSVMITTSTVDSVLSINNMSMKPGVPTWKFLLIFIGSIVYLAVIIKFLNFIWKHYRDMGYEVYHSIASGIAGRISNAVEGVGNRLHGDIGNSNKNAGAVNYNDDSTTTIKNNSDNPVKVKTVDSDVRVNNLANNESGLTNSMGDSGYTFETDADKYNNVSPSDIDKIIEDGKKE